jgi:HTH-type transcriptional regulator, quorum sensing regulator NprR
MTLEELSEGICSVSYLSKTETGKIEASDEILVLLGNKLGANFSDNNKVVDPSVYLRKLYHWYEQIILKNKHVNLIYEELSSELENIENPDLLAFFNLFECRYLLSYSDISSVEEKLYQLKKYSELFTKEQNYYFHKIYGLFYYLKGTYKISLDQLNESENFLKDCLIEDFERADFYYLKGLCLYQLYQIVISNGYIEQALDIYSKSYNLTRSTECLILLSINSRRVNDTKNAELHLLKALNVSKVINNIELEGVIYHNLGKLLFQKQEHLESISYHRKALDRLNDTDEILRCIYCIAIAYNELNEEVAFNKWKTQGLKLAESTQNQEQIIHFTLIKAPYYINDYEYEQFLIETALPFFLNKKDWKYIAQVNEELAIYFENKHKYKLASQYYKNAYDAHKNIIPISS